MEYKTKYRIKTSTFTYLVDEHSQNISIEEQLDPSLNDILMLLWRNTEGVQGSKHAHKNKHKNEFGVQIWE